MSHLRGGEKHSSRIGTGSDACAAADAGCRIKSGFRGILGHQNVICFRSAAGRRGDEASCLNNSIERRTIDGQIAQDGKGTRTPGFQRYRIAVLEETHRELTDRGAAPASVGYSVNQKTACAANSLAAIMLEGHWRLTLGLKIFVQQIEHLEKRHVRRHALHLIGDKPTGRLGILLPPNFE